MRGTYDAIALELKLNGNTLKRIERALTQQRDRDLVAHQTQVEMLRPTPRDAKSGRFIDRSPERP